MKRFINLIPIIIILLLIIALCFGRCNNTSPSVPKSDTIFSRTEPIIVYANIDTVFSYNSSGLDINVAKVRFEDKKITIMWGKGNTANFKIVAVDTSLQQPKFLKQ